jgi:hypothetical protein
MPIWYKWWQGCCKYETCKCEKCPSQFVKDNQLDEKFKKR